MTMPTRDEIRDLYNAELLRLGILAGPYAEALPALSAEYAAAEKALKAEPVFGIDEDRYHRVCDMMAGRTRTTHRERVLAELKIPAADWDRLDRFCQARARVQEAVVGSNPRLLAWRSVRSTLSGAIQSSNPPPHVSDFSGVEADAEVHHARQKAHFMGLWERVEAAVLDAGITAEGSV